MALIMSQPQMADRLAREHAEDGHGCCSTCTGGAQSGRFRYPCTIMRAVVEARGRLAASVSAAEQPGAVAS